MRKTLMIILLLALLTAAGAHAQDSDSADSADAAPTLILPAYHKINGAAYHAQAWNNCGPATLTSALSSFGYANDQFRAANFLKPDREDKNVSPWQMADFVNTQVPEIPVYALVRHGGSLDTLKTLVSQDFPVIIEKGYDPEPGDLGWMGHYLFIKGYDDSVSVFITNDSYIAEDVNYNYDYIQTYWQHFNYLYLVLYTSDREAELLALLGDDADETQNLRNALVKARDEAAANPEDAFAWFNMGTNLVLLEEYERAAIAYDQAFNVGLPWRMLWYQFGPFEAYNAMGRYNDTILYAQRNLNDGGGHYVEETFYFAGVAREGLGETQRAISNYQGALAFNPNFAPARERLDALQGQ